MLKYPHPSRIQTAVDCIIFGFSDGTLKLLLIKRNFPPEEGKWSLMGGFVNPEESLDNSARRILHTLTGLKNVYMQQLHTFGCPRRDPVERTISVAYFALINIRKHNAELLKKHEAEWHDISRIPHLIFDHNEMVSMARNQLKIQASQFPIGFELLPKKFTIPQLRKLYEAIFERPLDKRNFSRKILGMQILTKTGEKQTGFSKKGAYLYTFDKIKYDQFQETGTPFFIKP